jgi:tRNA(Ile2) C34 agmatinyltransferase TiaS
MDDNLEKYECEKCGCYFWVKDRNNFECPNCKERNRREEFMFRLKAWYRENGVPVRYIIEADTISHIWEQFTIDIDLTDVLEVAIYKEV